ncbi:helix-turn-helix domain-containing protein [Brevibacillus sp. SAFN-007a]|uniref:helix-turn-helix domain-containing protein n=1 Tax=Brevibacillus sp. SAFN-007a TaxID=3436862 RepID=UPI003F7D79C9
MGIGSKIKILRKRKGLTQSNLADGIISVPYLSLIENEKVTPPYDVLRCISDRLGSDFKQLIEESISEDEVCKEIEKIGEQLISALNMNDKNVYMNLKSLLEQKLKEYSAFVNCTFLIKIYLCHYFIEVRDVENAKVLLDTLEAEVSKWKNNNNIEFDIFKLKGDVAFLGKNYANAIKFYHLAENLMKDKTSFKSACLFYSLSYVYEIQYNPIKSLYYCRKAIDIFTEEYNVPLLIRSLLILGANYRKIGRKYDAENIFSKTIELSGENANLKIYKANALHCLGTISLQEKDYYRAFERLSESLKIKNSIKDDIEPESYADTYKQVSECYYLEGMYSDAYDYLSKAYSTLANLEKSYILGDCILLEGKIKYAEGNRMEAVKVVKKALKLFQSIGFTKGIAESAEWLGEYYKDRGNLSDYCKYLHISQNCYKTLWGVQS